MQSTQCQPIRFEQKSVIGGLSQGQRSKVVLLAADQNDRGQWDKNGCTICEQSRFLLEPTVRNPVQSLSNLILES